MQFVTFLNNGAAEPGILSGDTIIGLKGAGFSSLLELIEQGPPAQKKAADFAASAPASAKVPFAGAKILAPIARPPKLIFIGLNYRDHAAETKQEEPETPIVFAKFPSSLIADGESIELPPSNPDMVDWEGELAVVIGRQATRVPEADALECVAGYMPFNDVSGRDLQIASPQWTMGKGFDTSGPCGPALVVDEVEDPQALHLRTILNGEVVQDATTDTMIFSVAKLIAYLSSLITLEVGDIIATGTPSGVGFARDPKRFLRDGDEIEVDIEGVGRLRNNVRGGK
jgi:2-keto-4-pentenoate hydratase/2-oxohepta-3-ene-1,7-dioic acid hydratase in catechol pathway